MSNDESVTKDLIETLEDGKEGFSKAAEKLADSDHKSFTTVFNKYSEQRATFSRELRELAKDYGDNIKESGSVTAALHRGWISLKDALTGSDSHAVINAALQGEEHAVKEYEKALKEDISPTLRAVIERQAGDVREACAAVKAMSDEH